MYQKTLFVALLVLGTASMALAVAPTPQVAVSPSSTGGCGGAVSPALAGGLTGFLPVEQAIGDVSSAACCQSDPCPSTGAPVSCCATSCSASSDWVWCSGQGYTYCPVAPTCDPGASCFDDSNCGGSQGYGYCDKEVFEIEGSCVCYF